MSSANKDSFARAISLLSLIIAIAAIYIPYYQQEKQHKENLIILFNPGLAVGDIILTNYSFKDLGRVIQIPWQLTISNSGHNRLSIVEYQLSMGVKAGSVLFKGLDGGIKNKDWQDEKMPITLDGGESKTFAIYVGVQANKEVYDILKSMSQNSDRISYKRAFRELAKKGYDFYGNKVWFKEYRDDSYELMVKNEHPASPMVWIELLTGRGNKFYSNGSNYPRM
jgi:hypothetical protein